MKINIEMTSMLRRYLVKFIARVIIFVMILILYVRYREWTTEFLKHSFWTVEVSPFRFPITPLHVLWFLFMLIMLRHIFPGFSSKLTMALRKSKKEEYVPVPGYDEKELLKYVQKQNIRAWQVMLIWLSCNAVFGALYLAGVLKEADLLMLTVFYFLCDYICILFFCPFQTGVMKNKCCVNCRIYDWGHFMMFTPMLFIKSFFSWSLFFTSLVVLIHWEILYAIYPERFWEGSNQVLRCSQCKDKTCGIKKSIL